MSAGGVSATPGRSQLRVCQVLLKAPAPSETFFLTTARSLPAHVSVFHGPVVAHQDGSPVLSQSVVARGARKALRLASRRDWSWEGTASFSRAIERSGADVVLAEYGEAGLMVLDACVRTKRPLVVRFHGYDASLHGLVESLLPAYRRMFAQSAAILAVSEAMRQRLLALGAPPDKVHHRPCGVEVTRFPRGAPHRVGPVFVTVGRFVDKKAPHLTLLAFSRVALAIPEATLTMIGDGPLLGACRDLVRAMGLDSRVQLPGWLEPAAVAERLRAARALVQHSVQAESGDTEGTPVAVLEAGITGLPVIGTRHGGIPEVVEHERTGLLVDERDVEATSDAMIRLARDPALAARLGDAAAARVAERYSTVVTGRLLYNTLAQAAGWPPLR